MSKNKSEAECPVELESQFILRLPEEPAKKLRELLKTNGSLKNRLTIQIDNDMRHGEVRFDDWVLHAKIVDLPTIIESLKTIDTKSFYKTADICQLMICKEEPDQPTVTEDDSSGKLKKKDPYKVDKKFLWLHGITPPTKNVRKRRFRKTLRKKCVEAPEIEKEVKRLLRADNEAESVTYEVIQEDSEPVKKSEIKPPIKPEKKGKSGRKSKKAPVTNTTNPESSNVVDIFGGAVSDSDIEDDNPNIERETGDQYPVYDTHLLENSSPLVTNDVHGKKDSLPSGLKSKVQQYRNKKKASQSRYGPSCSSTPSTSGTLQYGGMSSGDENDYQTRDRPKENMTSRIEQLKAEVDELKQRRQRTQQEIAGIENLSLQQRFAEILHTLNQDIMYKEMEYQGLLTLQNSDII